MPPVTTKNLGLVQPVHVGTIAPTNIIQLWYDTNVGINRMKFYDTGSALWLLLTDKNEKYNFTSQTSLTVTHTMYKYPSVTVIDTSGNIITPQNVQYNLSDITKILITFASPTSGSVILN